MNSVDPAPLQHPPGAAPPWAAPALRRPPVRPTLDVSWMGLGGLGLFLGTIGLPFEIDGPFDPTAAYQLGEAPGFQVACAAFGSILLAMAGALFVAMLVSRRGHRAALVRELAEHEGLLAHLVTGWARILHREVAAEPDHAEDALSRYQLTLELELWPVEASSYRTAPTPVRCALEADFDAAVASHIVPGAYLGVAYDTRSRARLLPQCLVTTEGATLPV